MVLPTIRGGSWLLRWGVVALVATVPLAMAGAANASISSAESIQYVDANVAAVPGSSATFTNSASATETGNGRTAYGLSLKDPFSSASLITATNTSTATANCQGCDAVSIAFQAVIASQPAVNTIDATDTATASTTGNAQALAEAFQLIYTPGLLVYSPDLGLQLQLLQDKLQGLETPGFSNSLIESQSVEAVDAFVSWIQQNYDDGFGYPTLNHDLSAGSGQPYLNLLSEFHT
jgi:hypothetical protein